MNTAPTSNNSIELPELEIVEIDALAFATGKIKVVCRMRGMSWAELSRRSLIDEGKLGKSMRDERNLRFDEGLRVCHVLDIKPFDLLIPPELRRKMDEASRFDDVDVVPRARRGGARW
jgi:DNA-binding phage protein